MTQTTVATLVVPCYNEAGRLKPSAFLEALDANPCLQLVLVDDGSTDATRKVLETLASDSCARARVLALPANAGKAEAVRSGLLHALESNPSFVGYWDADLATPFHALPDFSEVLRKRPDVEIVLGSRVRLLGREIERHALRHYFGRVLSTGAAVVLGIPVYDTQCGAKLFRVTPRLHRMLKEPFKTRWVFDVELLARYLDDRIHDNGEPSEKRIYELALRHWVDEPGSKVRATDVIRAFSDLVRIYRSRTERERSRRAS